MVLSDLHLAAFRGMTDVHLERLSPVSVFVGANNSGKTSVLEAAGLLLNPFSPNQWTQVTLHRDMDAAPVDDLWMLFPSSTPLRLDDESRQSFPLTVYGSVGGQERRISAFGLAVRNPDSGKSEKIVLQIVVCRDRVSHTLEFPNGTSSLFHPAVRFSRCCMVTPATHLASHNLIYYLSTVIDNGEKPAAIELLQLFDPEISGIDIIAARDHVYVRVTHAKRGVVDLASFGDGMRRAVLLSLALICTKGGVLFIDELEAGIHPQILPKVLRRLFAAAKSFDVQILATTHSLEAIDALIASLDDSDTQVSAYYLQRNGQETMTRRYDREKLIQLREMGFDIR